MNTVAASAPDGVAPHMAKSRARICVVSGARSGIGAATSALLRQRGWTVIGIDPSGTDICADLSHAPDGATPPMPWRASAWHRLYG